MIENRGALPCEPSTTLYEVLVDTLDLLATLAAVKDHDLPTAEFDQVGPVELEILVPAEQALEEVVHDSSSSCLGSRRLLFFAVLQSATTGSLVQSIRLVTGAFLLLIVAYPTLFVKGKNRLLIWLYFIAYFVIFMYSSRCRGICILFSNHGTRLSPRKS